MSSAKKTNKRPTKRVSLTDKGSRESKVRGSAAKTHECTGEESSSREPHPRDARKSHGKVKSPKHDKLPIKKKQKNMDDGSITPSKQQHSVQKSRGDGGKASTTKHSKVSNGAVGENSHSASTSSKVTGSNKWVRSDNKKQPKLLRKSCFRIHIVTFEIMCMHSRNFDNLIRDFKADPKKFLHNTIGIRDDVYHGIYRKKGDEEWKSRSITITSYAFTTKADLDAMMEMLCELCTYAESFDGLVGWGRKTEHWVEE
jgi:hypothetical protein